MHDVNVRSRRPLHGPVERLLDAVVQPARVEVLRREDQLPRRVPRAARDARSKCLLGGDASEVDVDEVVAAARAAAVRAAAVRAAAVLAGWLARSGRWCWHRCCSHGGVTWLGMAARHGAALTGAMPLGGFCGAARSLKKPPTRSLNRPRKIRMA